MKLAQMNLVLKERTVMEGDKFYLYTYVNVKNGNEITISKQIPKTKKVLIEGNDNEVVLPVIPEELVITGDNNKVTIVEEDILEVPYFLTPEYKKSKSIWNRVFNR